MNTALTVTGLLLMLWSRATDAQPLPAQCGSLANAFGPYDYRVDRYVPQALYPTHESLLNIVERAHFAPQVENLIRGQTNSTPHGDLNYTLRVFPNHHRALVSVSNLALKENNRQGAIATYTIDCWFLRGINFRPDDILVRMIYANYLIRATDVDAAEQQLSAVAKSSPDGAFTHRNLGLLYFEAKSYEKALHHAHMARQLGLRIDSLTERLQSVGQWREPIAESVITPDATGK